MAKRAEKEMSVEEFEAWSAARRKLREVEEAADEVGGPRLSLVPLPEQNKAWPTDLVDDPAEVGESSPDGTEQTRTPATPFDGIPLESSRKRLCGWSAERQRMFLTYLAETGQVHLAAAAARLSARSAQALRVRSAPFDKAWRVAEQLASGRLSPMAFDRAINGRVEQIYKDGELIAERRVPNDKMLMWLLARLDPKRFALPWEQRGNADPQAEAAEAFPRLLDDLGDVVPE